jgi:hypothetical protein
MAMVGDIEKRSLLDWFEAALAVWRWNRLKDRSKTQIHTLRVVIWMMLSQRLNHCCNQQQAVHQVAERQVKRPLPDSKRVKEGKILDINSAYARACGGIMLATAEQECDEGLADLISRSRNVSFKHLWTAFGGGAALVGPESSPRCATGSAENCAKRLPRVSGGSSLRHSGWH